MYVQVHLFTVNLLILRANGRLGKATLFGAVACSVVICKETGAQLTHRLTCNAPPRQHYYYIRPGAVSAGADYYQQLFTTFLQFPAYEVIIKQTEGLLTQC